jgi:hypothetical protein
VGAKTVVVVVDPHVSLLPSVLDEMAAEMISHEKKFF